MRLIFGTFWSICFEYPVHLRMVWIVLAMSASWTGISRIQRYPKVATKSLRISWFFDSSASVGYSETFWKTFFEATWSWKIGRKIGSSLKLPGLTRGHFWWGHFCGTHRRTHRGTHRPFWGPRESAVPRPSRGAEGFSRCEKMGIQGE